MTIAYYISGHGLGHSARSAAIIRHLPSDIPLAIKTVAPEWFFRQELDRPFGFHAERFDCGALQGDTYSVDREATLRTCAEISLKNKGLIKSEAEWLRSIGARLVVADVPSFPLVAAKAAGIPAVAVANFFWVEIYRPYLKDFPQYQELVGELESEYAQADLAFVTPLDLPMRGFKNVRRVPLVARSGESKRQEIAQAFGLNPGRKWILVYPGNLGFPFPWDSLGRFGDIDFLSFKQNAANPPNVQTLEQGRFRHEDVVASVNGVAAKPGYGMVGECMANRTPLLYTDRDDFIEYEALDRALQEWGGAVRIDRRDFASGDWAEGLAQTLALRPPRIDGLNGAEVIARELAEIARTGMAG
jgi:L-arabinokinase